MVTGTVEHLLLPLSRYLDDKNAVEIMVTECGSIWVEKRTGDWKQERVPETTFEWWRNLAHAISIATGQAFSERRPLVKASLPGGHRLCLMLGSNVIQKDGEGVAAAIRLFRRRGRKLDDFGLDKTGADLLIGAIRARDTVLVAGGTGSGKTTLTQILCDVMEDMRPVYIEDTEELQPNQPAAVRLLVSPASADTEIDYPHVLDALTRLRPDRVVLGELTVDNAFITMRTLNMGMDGMVTTLHANSAGDAIPAMVQLLALKGFNAPEADKFFRQKIGVCVHCARDGSRRVITEIVRPHPAGEQVLWSRKDVAQVA